MKTGPFSQKSIWFGFVGLLKTEQLNLIFLKFEKF
jgi:hypothetical protein